MLQILIKESALILCGLYAYNRILNIQKRSETAYILKHFTFAIFLTLISYLVKTYLSYNAVMIQVIISFIFLTAISSISTKLSFSATTISYAISYCIYFLAGTITSIVFGVARVNPNTDFVYAQFCAFIIQFILIFLLFRLKRLQKGMPFLQKDGSNSYVLYLCLIALFSYIILTKNNGESIYFLPALLILICTVLIFVGWRYRITNDYRQKLHKRQINTMQEELKVQSEIITELEENLESLSKIIHKDNKLIPSMRMAVDEYLQSTDSLSKEQITVKGKALIKELDRISLERKEFVSNYELSGRKLISTNVISIDSLMNYMLQKSKENSIQLEFKCNIKLSHMIEHIISESNLNTLLADLLENAIIAERECSKRNILVDIGVIEGNYFVSIYDSGAAFTPEVLNFFGKKKITTHKNTGGSGIGLVSTYELIQKYEASLFIEEYQNNELFTKKLTILFDSQNLFKIISPRATVLTSSIKRADLQILTS